MNEFKNDSLKNIIQLQSSSMVVEMTAIELDICRFQISSSIRPTYMLL